jgi:hypothetical protein
MKKIALKKQVAYLKEIINAKCLECSCYQPDEVVLCEITTCPLNKIRPTDKKGLYSLSRQLKRKKIKNFEAESY